LDIPKTAKYVGGQMQNQCGLAMASVNSIETFTGALFDIIDPNPEDVRIADIAQGLSQQCRFAGQVRQFYSIAEHSVIVHDLLVQRHGHGEISHAGLFHDAAEAYVVDIPRPLKLHLPNYCDIEDRIALAIRTALEIEWDFAIESEVKWADNLAVRAEAHALMESQGEHWNWGDVELVPVNIVPYVPHAAKTLFLHTWEGYN